MLGGILDLLALFLQCGDLGFQGIQVGPLCLQLRRDCGQTGFNLSQAGCAGSGSGKELQADAGELGSFKNIHGKPPIKF